MVMKNTNELQIKPMTPENSIQKLGWNERFADQLASMPVAKGNVARVLSVLRKSILVSNGQREWLCSVAGRIKRAEDGIFPVTGDWVLVNNTIISSVIPRINALSRGAAGSNSRQSGQTARSQAIAANLDTVFIVCGLDRDFNVRRIERALTLVYNCGLIPVIVLTKADLHEQPETFVRELEDIAFDVPVVLSSKYDDRGRATLESYIGKGRTVAMLGTSGVGKSTLANTLFGKNIQATGKVSYSAGKGRHTTTRRELIHMPQGGMLMDSPGIREIAFFEDGTGVETAFPDIEALAGECRFSNCTHVHEPNCGVARAVQTGQLKADRLESYHKMKLELESFSKRRK